MKNFRSTGAANIGLAILILFNSTATAQRAKLLRHPAPCGNPNISCLSGITFEPNDLAFPVPRNSVIFDTERFYVVILRSVTSPAADNCDNYIPEPDRLAAQLLFPNNKVFTSRCVEPGHVSYSNTSSRAQFMAVYAGATRAEANLILAKVKATGKFAGANLRRIRAMVNGT